MRYFILLLLPLFISTRSSSQILRLSAGVSASSMEFNYTPLSDYYDINIIKPAVFIGVSYLNRKHFNLSTNGGYLQKGGKEKVAFTDGSGNDIGEGYDGPVFGYVSLNTTADIKIPINNLTPYISIGPRIDYLISDNNRLSDPNKISYGGLLGVGVSLAVNKMHIGLQAAYLPSFNNVIEPEYGLNGSEQTFLTSLVLGYNLR